MDTAELKAVISEELKAVLEKDDERFNKLAERLKAVEDAWTKRVDETLPGYSDAPKKDQFHLVDFLRYAASKKVKGVHWSAEKELDLIKQWNSKRQTIEAHEATLAGLAEDKANPMGTTPDTLGGYLVPTELLGSEFIASLEANVVIRSLGARSLNGLRGSPVEIPRKTSGATAYYTAENDAITESELALGEVKLVPRQVGAAVRSSRRLLMMANLDVDQMIRDDIVIRFAQREDLSGLKGSGPNTPTGIITDGDVPSASLASVSLDDLMDFENTVAENDALKGRTGFAMRPSSWNTIRKLKDGDSRYQLAPDPTGATPMRLLGHPVLTTTQLLTTEAIFGNWQDLIIGVWEAIEFAVTTEGESTFLKNQALIRGLMLHDMALRQPKSFVKSTDFSAA